MIPISTRGNYEMPTNVTWPWATDCFEPAAAANLRAEIGENACRGSLMLRQVKPTKKSVAISQHFRVLRRCAVVICQYFC